MSSRLGKWNFMRRFPMAFSVIYGGVKCGAADLLVQSTVEGNSMDDMNWRRVATFTMFGALYVGGFQFLLYSKLFTRFLPQDGLKGTVTQTFADQFVHSPLLYFPSFYCFKEILDGSSPTPIETALNKYRVNFKDDMCALWRLWVPISLINFYFVPPPLRSVFFATIGFFWTAYLSYSRGAINPVEKLAETVDAKFEAEFNRVFALSDVDGDGLVSRAEFERFLRSRLFDYPEMMRQMFELAAVDHDGASVDAHEFADFIVFIRSTLSGGSLWRELDVDGAGVLTREEMVKGFTLLFNTSDWQPKAAVRLDEELVDSCPDGKYVTKFTFSKWMEDFSHAGLVVKISEPAEFSQITDAIVNSYQTQGHKGDFYPDEDVVRAA